ncbi:hypothetical protein [Pseudomonas orientalis]|uniref:Uncharacterized protein n=1 Tax=Pseudomonas orientalis TaxID=76758 RepID=A0A2L0RXK6_9PSED|nr:hypothetical protein [Pseudomonas orientalis]AUZ46833.1 hypothetical protein BOP93_14885 [Pseudomonas orientalis]
MFEVPMYRKNGSRIELQNLLEKVPANDWVWLIIEFDGVANLPNDESIDGFQNRIRCLPKGLVKTWEDILSFSRCVDYTIDCLIVAVSCMEQVGVEKLLGDDFQNCLVFIRAIDSTDWMLHASNSEILDGLKVVTG